MLSKEKMIDMQEVVDDCKSFSGMSFSGNLFKVTQFQKAPGLLGEALEEVISLREQLAELKALPPVSVVELNDNLTVAEIRGDIPRRKAVRELYEGALVIGQELFTAANPAED
ncbi:hypothetical protein WFM01_03205 [Yersinia enterocolitica]